MNIKSEITTVSNLLSLLRLVMAVPLWFLVGNLGSGTARASAVILCLAAALTDILDGYYARKLNQVTETGKIIDPLADKVVVGALVLKLFTEGIIPGYYFFLIAGRDILIFIGGIIVSKKIGKVLPSNMLGKITVINISLVLLYFILMLDKDNFIFLSLYTLSIFLIIASFIGYVLRAVEFIKQKKNYEAV